MADLCKHCGKPESEHHAFEARAGCACFRKSDTQPFPPPCGKYVAMAYSYSWCICGHDAACHAPKD